MKDGSKSTPILLLLDWFVQSNKKGKINVRYYFSALRSLISIIIEKWSYQTQDFSIRHMGPYAQDFYAAFGLGENPLGISTIDSDGVALAAIKGMHGLFKDF